MFLVNHTQSSCFFVGILYALHHLRIALSLTPYFLPVAQNPIDKMSFANCSGLGLSTVCSAFIKQLQHIFAVESLIPPQIGHTLFGFTWTSLSSTVMVVLGKLFLIGYSYPGNFLL